jgi:hypothetical protein
MDHDKRPCPSIRFTAKQEMVDYFKGRQEAEKNAAASGEGETQDRPARLNLNRPGASDR